MAEIGPSNDSTLIVRLAKALPLDSRFDIYHLSSIPTPCPAIYSAPPGKNPEKTFCESHFLSVTIDSAGRRLQIFALEALIYTTEYLTTLFVSKADSTGYIHLLNLPNGTPSPLKTISTIFLAFLIETRRRAGRKLVLSLFARAQDQYLFPGSIENCHKHVLDDRGLIKWWCQVLDPILHRYPCPDKPKNQEPGSTNIVDNSYTSRGYLRVPGCDLHETRCFFPRPLLQLPVPRKWLPEDPLRDLGRSSDLPERSLIPRFPDDPKARFVDELDDELPETLAMVQKSPSKFQYSGRWKSVRSLEQFWELMAFRQECSSGRLVGFLWGVFTPAHQLGEDKNKNFLNRLALSTVQQTSNESPTSELPQEQITTHRKSKSPIRLSSDPEASKPTLSRPKIMQPQPSTGPVTSLDPRTAKPLPEKSRYFYWPTIARGEVVLREKDYQRVNNLLIHLDYANEEIAAKSTKRWIDDVAVVGRVEKWGHAVRGLKQVHAISKDATSSATMLNTSLMRKKKRPNDSVSGAVESAGAEIEESAVNVLSAGLIRKKVKTGGNSGNVP